MKKNYSLKKLFLSILVALTVSPLFSQGNCSDLQDTIRSSMGQSVEPSGFFVRSGSQTGRLSRNGTPAVCPTKAFPGPFGTSTLNYTTVRFFNTSDTIECLTINFEPNKGTSTPCGTNAFAMVYQSSDGLSTTPYDPSSQSTNYIGDAGSSATIAFSCDVKPGWFEVVFTNTSTQDNCAFQFRFGTNGNLMSCIDPSTGINSSVTKTLEGIELFPNPADGRAITIKNGSGNTITNIEIFDVMGKRLMSKPMRSNIDYVLELQNLEAGIYSVRITSENNAITTKKLIVR